MFEDNKNHESFGMISFSQVSCSQPMNLFGSSIKHNQVISLKINSATLNRHLHTDYFFSDKNLIEVKMSYSQFAEAITAMNTSGVPVTISYLDGKYMEECPDENKRQVFDRELGEEMEKVSQGLDGFMDNMNKLFNSEKALTKKDKEAMINQMRMLQQEIKSNIPFMKKQFTQSMDKTVLEAKGEVEGFWLNKIYSLGLDALQQQVSPILIEEDIVEQ